MAQYAWRPLGELLVKRGLIDEYQLESLLLEQRLSGQLFGEMLVAKRVISPDDMAAVLAEQHGLHLDPAHRPTPAVQDNPGADNGSPKWRPLGRILVDRDVLTESGLQRVLMAQRRKGGLLGQLLVERGYVTSQELAEALAEQHGVAMPPEALAVVEQGSAAANEVVYEVRNPGANGDSVVHVSTTFLDASDFAFELLYDEDPDALEIVEVNGDRRKTAWSYVRPAG